MYCFNCMHEIDSFPCPHCDNKDQPVQSPNYLTMGETLGEDGRFVVGKMINEDKLVAYLGYDTHMKCIANIKEYFPQDIASRSVENKKDVIYKNENFEKIKEEYYKKAGMASKYLGYNLGIAKTLGVIKQNKTVYVCLEKKETLPFIKFARKEARDESVVKEMLKQLLMAIGKFHENGFALGTVKNAKILEKDDKYIVHVADYGIDGTMQQDMNDFCYLYESLLKGEKSDGTGLAFYGKSAFEVSNSLYDKTTFHPASGQGQQPTPEPKKESVAEKKKNDRPPIVEEVPVKSPKDEYAEDLGESFDESFDDENFDSFNSDKDEVDAKETPSPKKKKERKPKKEKKAKPSKEQPKDDWEESWDDGGFDDKNSYETSYDSFEDTDKEYSDDLDFDTDDNKGSCLGSYKPPKVLIIFLIVIVVLGVYMLGQKAFGIIKPMLPNNKKVESTKEPTSKKEEKKSKKTPKPTKEVVMAEETKEPIEETEEPTKEPIEVEETEEPIEETVTPTKAPVKKATVPSVIGYSKETAINKIHNAGLQYKVIGYEYDNSSYGTVLKQSVSAGTKVKKKSFVKLTLSAGKKTSNSPSNNHSSNTKKKKKKKNSWDNPMGNNNPMG